MAKRPNWTGKLLDANGRVGKLELDVGEEGRGDFSVELMERDGHPVVLRGPITFVAEGRSVRLRSPGQQQEKGPRVPFEASLTRAEAGRYAKAAMLGTYSTEGGGGSEMPLTTGVVILWQFS